MRGSVRDNKPKFDTSLWYAPFNGWLIVPALMTLLLFIGAIIMVVFVRPSVLNVFDLAIYWMDVFHLLYLFITLLLFIESIMMFFFVRASVLNGFDLAVYGMDGFNLVYLFITYLLWIARKKILPILMIIFFIVMSIWIIVMYTYNEAADYFNLVASIIWILYFIRSERVKQTFVR